MPIPSTIRDRIRREIEQELNEWVPRIVAEMQPERIILFGSAARGEAGEASDIDLTVIAATELDFFDRIGRVMSLYRGDREINVLVYTPAEWDRMLAEGRKFITRMADGGRVLYERAEGTG